MLTECAPARRRLGKSGLDVCRIGIGGGNQLSAADLDYAVARGVNYVFVSSDFHAPLYAGSHDALRRACRGPARERLVVAVATYVGDADKLLGIVADQIYALGVDYVDVFQWGWVSPKQDPDALLQAADALRARGYARFVGISTHDRALAATLASHPSLDVLMLRYNIRHRGAERDVFPHLPAERPGIITFNSLHSYGKLLTAAPPGLPHGKYVPAAGDLYRFALTHPDVDVVLTGPSERRHIDEALDALARGPLDDRYDAYFRKLGDLHAARAHVVEA